MELSSEAITNDHIDQLNKVKGLAQMQKFEPAFAMKTSRIKKEAQKTKKASKRGKKEIRQKTGTTILVF